MFLWSAILFVVISGHSKDITLVAHTAHSLTWIGELHVKAGYVSTLLAGAPSLHVNRPHDIPVTVISHVHTV